MAQPTPENLLQRALTTGGGRNKAGLWLAQQLHANGYDQADAEAIMKDYALSVPQLDGKDPYTEREALSTLKAEYKRQALQPWTTADQRTNYRRDRRAQAPTLAPRTAPKPDPETQAKLQRQLSSLKPFSGSPAVAYLETRGIPAELAKLATVKYSPCWYFPDVKKESPAAVFPLRDATGRVIAAQGRALEPTGGSDKITYGQKTLGCFTTPGALESDPIAIVEAPIDALTLAIAGMPAIATCGSGTAEWLREILAFKTVFLATDNDPEGEEYARKIPNELIPYGAKCYRLRPPVKDWNELLQTSGLDTLLNLIDAAYIERAFVPPTLPDPRPDLTGDTNAWIRLLRKVEPESDLHAALYAFRGSGARLTGEGIVYTPEGSTWTNAADFQADYEGYLGPFTQQLKTVLEA